MAEQKVSIPSDHPKGACSGVIVPKEGRGALILLHAWWGLNEEIVEHARQVSKASGLTVLVPDLYRGKLTEDRETAGHYMADLDWHGAVCDVRACARYLNGSGKEKVGVSGFCMGGALCWLAAALVVEIDAAAPFYGISKPHLADLTAIRVPVQGHFGELDTVVGLSSPADFYPLKEKLTAAGVNFDLRVYKTAGHGFAHPSYATYDPDAADKAFSAMYDFMKQHLSV